MVEKKSHSIIDKWTWSYHSSIFFWWWISANMEICGCSISLSQWNMLDIVNYFNHRVNPSTQPEIGFDTNAVNCVPHFYLDLFSLSVFS